MRTTTVVCDRCRRTIEAHGSILEAVAGPLRDRTDARLLDLCRACGEAFASWLAAGSMEFDADAETEMRPTAA